MSTTISLSDLLPGEENTDRIILFVQETDITHNTKYKSLTNCGGGASTEEECLNDVLLEFSMRRRLIKTRNVTLSGITSLQLGCFKQTL